MVSSSHYRSPVFLSETPAISPFVWHWVKSATQLLHSDSSWSHENMFYSMFIHQTYCFLPFKSPANTFKEELFNTLKGFPLRQNSPKLTLFQRLVKSKQINIYHMEIKCLSKRSFSFPWQQFLCLVQISPLRRQDLYYILKKSVTAGGCGGGF